MILPKTAVCLILTLAGRKRTEDFSNYGVFNRRGAKKTDQAVGLDKASSGFVSWADCLGFAGDGHLLQQVNWGAISQSAPTLPADGIANACLKHDRVNDYRDHGGLG